MAVGQGVYYAKWMGECQIGTETTYNTAAATPQLLVCLDEPDVSPGIPPQSQDGTYGRGTSEQFSADTNPGLQSPTIRFAFQVNELALSVVARTLFQGGSSVAAGPPVVNTCIPYTDGNPATYKGFTFSKVVKAGVAKGAHRFTGCVARSLTVSAERGGLVRCEVEALAPGYSYENVASQSTVMAGAQRWMYWNTDIKDDGTSLAPPATKWSFTVNNGAEYDHANQQTPYAILLGPLEITGMIGSSWRSAAGDLGATTWLTDWTTIAVPVTSQMQFLVGTAGQITAGDFNLKGDIEWDEIKGPLSVGQIVSVESTWKMRKVALASTLVIRSTGNPDTGS